MTCPDFRDELAKYDINIFQETRLEEDQFGMIDPVDGYDMWSVEREYKRDDDQQWGGVVVIAREELHLRKARSLGSVDVLVLESDTLVLVGAYILPEGSPWETFTNIHPYDKLEEVMTMLGNDPRQVLVMGDLNARVGGARAHPTEPRTSKDATTTVRGRALLRRCEEDGYYILNGTLSLGASCGDMTSHHDGCGEAVIDYAIGNARLLEDTISLEVVPRREDWSDHSEVVIKFKGRGQWGRQGHAGTRPKKEVRRRWRQEDLYGDKEVDGLVLEAINSIPPPEEEIRLMYGPAFCATNPVQVYVDGSSRGNGGRDPRAGSGVYFGPGNRKNIAVRVPDSQTNNRAEVYAVLSALKACNVHQSLIINCDSQYVIDMLTEWAPRQQSTGWRTVNGDIFRDVAQLLRGRPAPVHFRKVKAHSGNAHNDGADALAKEGASMPTVAPYGRLGRGGLGCQCDPCQGVGLVREEEKVTWDLRRKRGDEGRGQYEETEGEARSALTASRTREKEKQLEARMRLFGAKGPLEFYRELNVLRNPKATACDEFSADDLKGVFEERMNPIFPMPPSFDTTRMQLNREVASAVLQDGLDDLTPRGSLSRPFEMGELEGAKLDLRKRWGSAKGEDHVTYRDICRMDNDCLLRLVNECAQKGQIPSPWLRTQLVGLCKKGKPKSKPASYRTIGLESCFLKLLTGLVKDRLVEMADDLKILPPSQNGFREGYRTNNNTFILRCAAEKAKSMGKPLYTAFVDLTNAFPSTDQDTLWLKLRKWGAGGPLFDWLRKLYREMEYTVLHNSKKSSEFQSSIGILIGDTCSPILWALYMADLPEFIPGDAADVRLGSVTITHLEQADDVVLMSTTAEGLQRKLDGMSRWCSKNFMLFNASKSAVMILGGGVRHVASFSVGNGDAERVEIGVVATVTYLGITLSPRVDQFMRKHYTDKAAKAKRAARVIAGVQQLVGTLPVQVATQLYMALVDPHLTHGCEVVLDHVDGAREELEGVQNTFVRKVIRVGMRCMEVILFTETGLIPIRYRRLEFSLRFLVYAMQCPRGHYVREAMEEAVEMDFGGDKSWISDLRTTVQRLPFDCAFPTHDLLGDPDVVTHLVKLVRDGARADLQRRVEGSSKLYLLHGRLEMDEDGRLTRTVPVFLRHYLRVTNPAHRVALTQVLLSGHKYAIEAGRRGKNRTAREDRTCRLCEQGVESPEHVWLECNAAGELQQLRKEMAGDLMGLCTPEEFDWVIQAGGDTVEMMKRLVTLRSSVSRVAQYAFDVARFMAREVRW